MRTAFFQVLRDYNGEALKKETAGDILLHIPSFAYISTYNKIYVEGYIEKYLRDSDDYYQQTMVQDAILSGCNIALDAFKDQLVGYTNEFDEDLEMMKRNSNKVTSFLMDYIKEQTMNTAKSLVGKKVDDRLEDDGLVYKEEIFAQVAQNKDADTFHNSSAPKLMRDIMNVLQSK